MCLVVEDGWMDLTHTLKVQVRTSSEQDLLFIDHL